MMLLYDPCQGERHACLLEGSLREQGKPGVEAMILNISEAGCRLDSHVQLEEGTRIWVRLPGLQSQEARVVWSRGGSAGCRFAQPLHPAVVQRLLGNRLPRDTRVPR